MDVNAVLQAVQRASLEGLDSFARSLIGERLPTNYIQSLSDKDKIDALRACLLVYIITATMIVPREFQLEAVLATLNDRDSVITAGTGCGKTLCLILPIILRPDTISMTISPLKRLQITQVKECLKYGISTISINEDTPNDASTWQSIRTGKFNHLIVSPEQLFIFNGRLPRLARLIRQDGSFIKRIKRVHGKLGELRVLLSKGTTFQALSATLPPYILSAVKHELLIPSDNLSLTLSTNRPNITYAVTPLIGGPRNFHNFDCLIPLNYAIPMIIPKTLIFHDNELEAVNAAAYNNSRLPKALQNHGVVKHYHSNMSPEYLQQTYEDFASDNGSCRILHATAASTDLNIRCVSVVIQYGVPRNMSEAAQRRGRAAWDDDIFGLFLMMVEPWALELELTDKHDDDNDPDKPYAGVIKKNSSKQDRTGCAVLRYIQSKMCLREFYAKYLRDETPAGDIEQPHPLFDFTDAFPLALHYISQYCCDRHSSNHDFNLSQFFLGPMYTGGIVATTSQPMKHRRNQLRDENERDLLHERLSDWRAQEHALDPLRSVWPITWICDDNDLELLSKTHPNNLRSARDITNILHETEEWGETYGQRLLEVINQFTSERQQARNLESVAKRACISRLDDKQT
ncbi:P-loop containing nucleoside triphosphate hydrolase protein [Suillus subluteus]|nr:P-loop containing nucleoside triphosphate hydrolase protein [Suillus subluteus]